MYHQDKVFCQMELWKFKCENASTLFKLYFQRNNVNTNLMRGCVDEGSPSSYSKRIFFGVIVESVNLSNYIK